MFIIWLLIIGLIAGALARLLVPGRDPMGILGTIVLGVVGSLVGGFLGNLIFKHSGNRFDLTFAGILGSVIGAIIVLLIWRAVSGRNRTSV
ncbi:MAG TPA: GlsB/YeaQ/YmgE family stress response membrane protein [Mycobacteriales bacterium]|nr:GlsB/YeaQ/YmgE family stress response membrane protein [Mycobacteriales bacterium]